MVYDKIENLNKYVSREDYEKMKRFLDIVAENMAEGKYEIDGNLIYANVESYDTKEFSDCRIEAHNAYIDIQCAISGAEGIGVYHRSDLEAIDEYDAVKDVIHFNKDTSIEVAHTVNRAGYFTMLYPDEAHCPKQKVTGFSRVKKYVIKMRYED